MSWEHGIGLIGMIHLLKLYNNQKTNNYSQIGFWSWIQGPENKKTAYGTYELEYYEKENNQVLTKVIFYKLGETS